MSALEHDERCERRPDLMAMLCGYCQIVRSECEHRGLWEAALNEACGCAERALTAARQREEEAKGEIEKLRERCVERADKIIRLEEAAERPKCAYCDFGERDQVTLDLLRWHVEKECSAHPIYRLIQERDALRTENDRLTLAASEAQEQAETWRLGLGQANDKLLELQTAASESARTLQVRIAELEAGERHCDEYHGELADQVTALREAIPQDGA